MSDAAVLALSVQQGLQLHPLTLQLPRLPGALRPQIEAALAVHGRPLRWAVTAVQPAGDGTSTLQIEAVVISPAAAS